jgi:hypothetical protein
MAIEEKDGVIKHTEEWIYIGIHIDGLKKSYTFERPTDAGCCSCLVARPTFTKSVLPAYAKPGSVWGISLTIPFGEDPKALSILTKGPKKPRYLGMIDDERCAVLQATHAAAEVELRMLKKAKADMSDLEIDRILEPLREEYAKRNRVGKAALLAVIYSRIGLI